ncbi:MAG: hypothetical protein QXZ28_04955 [Candidatus Methanomethylicaceae archaeon]
MFKPYSHFVGKTTDPERWTGTAKTLVVPNQSMSIREIVTRYASGQTVVGSREHYYDGSEDFDAFDPTLDPNFDLADYTEMQNEISKSFLGQKGTPPADGGSPSAGAQQENSQEPVKKAKSEASSQIAGDANLKGQAPSAESAKGVQKVTTN